MQKPTDYVRNVINANLEDEDLTIEELADEAGIESWRIKFMMNVDLVHMSMKDAVRISEVLNISPYDLYIGAQERRLQNYLKRNKKRYNE